MVRFTSHQILLHIWVNHLSVSGNFRRIWRKPLKSFTNIQVEITHNRLFYVIPLLHVCDYPTVLLSSYISIDFCCYSFEELVQIKNAIAQYHWKPFNMTFDRISCNGFHHNNTNIDFFALLTEESNAEMQAWIKGLENAIAAAGMK